MLLAISCFSQKVNEADVPDNIKSAFRSRIADTVTINWEKISTSYFAHFVKGNMNAFMEIRETGEWIKTSWSIPPEYIPARIKTHIEQNYAGYKIRTSAIEYRVDGEFYSIEAKKKKDIVILTYSIKTDFVKADKKPDLKNKSDMPKPEKKK